MTESAWCYFRCLVHACYREARHIGPPEDPDARCKATGVFTGAATLCQSNRALLKGLVLWERTELARTTADVLAPYVAASGLPPEQLPRLFNLPAWRRKYGGPLWARIAEVMLELRDAIDLADAPRAQALCELAQGLHHNSGALVPDARRWSTDHWQRKKWPHLCP